VLRLSGRRVVVCCGAGGVGKTTVSAAVGLGLARRGARAAVVTIDPARRLATALGLADLGDQARRVPLGPGAVGELWALQLDARATFDRLVGRYAPSPEARDRILANRVYGHLSGAVAGAQEYMAVERLYELIEEGRYDVIVLDTPPARNALDFLDAPERITRFIEGRSLRLLLRPGAKAGRMGIRALHAGGAMVLSLLERLTGAQLLRDVAEFLAAFEGMYDGFSERAKSVRRLLESPSTTFIVVSAPGPEPRREAVALWRRLVKDGYPVGGLVLNRVMEPSAGGPVGATQLASLLAAAGAPDADGLARRVAVTAEEVQRRAMSDRRALEELRAELGGPPVTRVPELTPEPVELAGLTRVSEALIG
jgi:anion-transporting  ArsA/GET3 family ATPase